MSDNRASYYERIRGRLLALVIELGDRLTLDEQNWAHEYVDANELGLALEMIADWLSEGLRPIAAAERDTMLGLVEEMGMGDRVARALDLCPTKLDRGEGGDEACAAESRRSPSDRLVAPGQPAPPRPNQDSLLR